MLFSQSVCLSLTFCLYELLSVFICLPSQRELGICACNSTNIFFSFLPRVSKCLQWVIIHCIGWLFRWITCIELFPFTSPTHNFSCSHMAINAMRTHTYKCRRTNIVQSMCCSECLHTIWVIHCSPDPLLKMLNRTSRLANDSCQIPLIPPCWIRQFFDGVLAA